MKLFHGTDCAANKSPPIPPVPTMSLHQLQELASRQQGQIETAHRLLMNQEQRFQYLCSLQDSQQGPIFEYDQHLSHFKEKVAQQEAKLKKLRLLKGQIQKQKCSNSNICSELETVKLLYKEKERELSVALTKIEALTRQLDELKKGNIPNNYSTKGYKHAIELEKLRQELLFKTKLFKKNEEELILKRNMLYKRQADILKIDKKIVELQSRLARKRQLNLQLSYRDGHQVANPDSILAQKWLLTQSNQVPYHKLANIATVEPLQRYKASTLEYDFPQFNFGASKQDPKYQTLPYNTKFGSMKNSCNYENQLKVENGGSGDNMSCDIDRNGSLRINAKSETSEEALEERPSPSGSSGSSDRISTSLNSYTFSDKMAFNAISQHNHYYSQLDKYSHPVSENELFSRHYVPNSEFALTSVTQTKLEKDSSASSLDNHCKAKPSVPVKPLAALENRVPSDTSRLELMNSVGNGINSNNNYYAKRIHPTETFETARQSYYSLLPSLDRSPTKSDSTVPKLVHSSEFDEKQHEVENEDDNMRNHEIEQKSSVSEIVSKLNNLSSLGETKEWAKMRRRPVFSSNEMEKELERSPMRDEQCNPYSAYEGQENTDQIADSDHSNSKNRADSQDLVNNNDTREDKTNWTEESSDSRKGSDSKGVSDSPLKRLKGSLKRDEGRLSKIPLGRRVSFDPLALLLDAALEGELELVKKTSQEVSNPSASNDEGITALHNATCAGHFEIVKYLVEIGCDVNVQDSDGWTPLHCAASCNNLMMIKFLVKSGACVFATTCSDHETAAEKCEEDEEGFDGCSQYLYGIQDKLGVLNNGIVYALYDYESQNNDELSFKVSDRIQVLRKGDAQEKEWWWSKLYDREGYIPRNLIGLYPRIEPNRSKF